MSSRVFVGNLPSDIRERELDDFFYKFGRIRDIEIIRNRDTPQTYGFVTFSDSRDARDACDRRDGNLNQT